MKWKASEVILGKVTHESFRPISKQNGRAHFELAQPLLTIAFATNCSINSWKFTDAPQISKVIIVGTIDLTYMTVKGVF